MSSTKAEQRFMKSPKGKKYLQKKIAENMKEWKRGRWVSQKQALAVSYSETRQYFHHMSKKKKNGLVRKHKRNSTSGNKHRR